jgi:4-hydroxy-3-methylbut-2-enyl diphosphate reductase
MKIKLAVTAGFCMGVRRAMELTMNSLRNHKSPIYTFGPLIHNPQVLAMLEQKGVRLLEEIPAPGSIDGGAVILRAHGVAPAVKAALKTAGFSHIIDGTCGRVVRVQNIIRRAADAGMNIIIVGDAKHPEVAGLLAHAGNRGLVVGGEDAVEQLPQSLEKVVAVAQTTQNQEFYDHICRLLRARYGEIRIHQTICQATRQRQAEIMQLAREVDCVVVVGGRQSANSKRLAALVEDSGRPAVLVEDESALPDLTAYNYVGITAGASTPNWMIKRVTRHLKDLSQKRLLFNPLLRAGSFMSRSQMLSGVSAGLLSLALCRLLYLPLDWIMAAVACFFILPMHLINDLLERQADQYNDPGQTMFLQKHKNRLWGLSIASALLSLSLACWRSGILPLVVLMAMAGMGMIYSLPIMPASLRSRWGIKSLRDIPGSKTIAVMLAWGTVTALLPLWCAGVFVSLPGAMAFVYVAGLIFIKHSIIDVVSIQGDLFVGKETLPIVWGKRKTKKLIWAIYLGLAALLAVCLAVGIWPYAGLSLFVPLLTMGLLQDSFFRQSIFPEVGSKSLLELCLWTAIAAVCL